MLFNSYEFILLYLPLTLVGFFLIARRSPWGASVWLSCLSLVFYGWWDWRYVGLLLASIWINYLAGRTLCTVRQRRGEHAARFVLLAAIGLNLALLGFFKYANFFIAASGLDVTLDDIALPLGISFFTFTQIAFLVDVHQGKAREFRFASYCLFVTYFPHLIAGPVLHHKEMMPQFEEPRIYRPDWDMIAAGSAIFVLGLFKKVMIADKLAPFATFVFNSADNGVPLTLFEAWGGALAYTFQIYFDFCGYSEMAIGLSAMFGIRLPINFLSPYKATSIIDFWRRWHITLSRFLRDYLYIPLGGNRHGRPRRWANLMITMAVGGLWHGAGWTFVAWGVLHGLYLLVNHAWNEAGVAIEHRFGWRPRLAYWPARLLTFLAVVVAWVFFRADNLETAIAMLAAMTGQQIVSLPASLSALQAALPLLQDARFDGMFLNFNGKLNWPMGCSIIFLGMMLAWCAPNLPRLFGHRWPGLDHDLIERGAPAAWRWPVALAPAVGGMLLICLVSLGEISEFLYFQF